MPLRQWAVVLKLLLKCMFDSGFLHLIPNIFCPSLQQLSIKVAKNKHLKCVDTLKLCLSTKYSAHSHTHTISAKDTQISSEYLRLAGSSQVSLETHSLAAEMEVWPKEHHIGLEWCTWVSRTVELISVQGEKGERDKAWYRAVSKERMAIVCFL